MWEWILGHSPTILWLITLLLGSGLAALLKKLRPNYVVPACACLLIEFLIALRGVFHMGASAANVLTLTGIGMVLTFLCFYYWEQTRDGTRRKWFPKSSAFEKLIPELKHAVDVLKKMDSVMLEFATMGSPEPPMMDRLIHEGIEVEDFRRIDQLVRQLSSMDIHPSYFEETVNLYNQKSREVWSTHFLEVLHHAEHGNYKKYVEILHSREVPF